MDMVVCGDGSQACEERFQINQTHNERDLCLYLDTPRLEISIGGLWR